jgi:hypothetical protein
MRESQASFLFSSFLDDYCDSFSLPLVIVVDLAFFLFFSLFLSLVWFPSIDA